MALGIARVAWNRHEGHDRAGEDNQRDEPLAHI
jgi:hypothetical protein